jgi:hypothetical protein
VSVTQAIQSLRAPVSIDESEHFYLKRHINIVPSLNLQSYSTLAKLGLLRRWCQFLLPIFASSTRLFA